MDNFEEHNIRCDEVAKFLHLDKNQTQFSDFLHETVLGFAVSVCLPLHGFMQDPDLNPHLVLL